MRIVGCLSLHNADANGEDRPIGVVVVEEGHDLLGEMRLLYQSQDDRRWKRLCREPYWLFPDLFYLATRWDMVIKALTENLASVVGEPQTTFSFADAPPDLRFANAL